jgi:hypothetical protein
VADLDHGSAPEAVISTMYFISGWSLCGLLMWPFDNHGADHGENAKCIPRAKGTVRLCSDDERPDRAVRHGFCPSLRSGDDAK